MVLSDEYVRGFVDGEGSFRIIIMRDKTTRIKWEIRVAFQVGLSKREANLDVLKGLHAFFGVGEVYEGRKFLVYLVQDAEDIARRVIPLFDEHRLIVKGAEFEVWKRIVHHVIGKRHLSRFGLIKYVIPSIEELYSLRTEKRPRTLLKELKKAVII